MRFIYTPLLFIGALAQTVLAAEEGAEHMASAVEHAEHAEHAPASLFDGSFYQSGAAIIVFLIVFFVLKSKAWGPMLVALQDRENKIKADMAAAEKAANDAKTMLEDYRKQLANANEEGRKVIEQARNDAQRVANQLRDQTAAEITVLKQRAEADIRAAKETALAEVYEQTANLATSVAGKILRRQITAEDQQALVRESLAEMNKPGKKN